MVLMISGFSQFQLEQTPFYDSTTLVLVFSINLVNAIPNQGLTITRKLYKPGRASGIWNILALLQPVLALPENPNNH